MQTEFNLRLRVNFTDSGKAPEFEKTFLKACQQLVATAELLTDIKGSTKVDMNSETNHYAHRNIMLMDLKDINGLVEDDEIQPISSEMMEALKNGL
jgi:hypothetical protein